MQLKIILVNGGWSRKDGHLLDLSKVDPIEQLEKVEHRNRSVPEFRLLGPQLERAKINSFSLKLRLN
jgi:hypothetical protein